VCSSALMRRRFFPPPSLVVFFLLSRIVSCREQFFFLFFRQFSRNKCPFLEAGEHGAPPFPFFALVIEPPLLFPFPPTCTNYFFLSFCSAGQIADSALKQGIFPPLLIDCLRLSGFDAKHGRVLFFPLSSPWSDNERGTS